MLLLKVFYCVLYLLQFFELCYLFFVLLSFNTLYGVSITLLLIYVLGVIYLLENVGYLIKSIALNRFCMFLSLVQCPFSEHISPDYYRSFESSKNAFQTSPTILKVPWLAMANLSLHNCKWFLPQAECLVQQRDTGEVFCLLQSFSFCK